MSDARQYPCDRADRRRTGPRQPVDPTCPGSQKEKPPHPTGRKGGGERQRRQQDDLPSGHPSASQTAARLPAEPMSAVHPRLRSDHRASAAQSEAGTCAHRRSILQRWHALGRHPSTAASLCLQRGADAHRHCHCPHLHGRAPPGRGLYRTALRHCWPGAILGRHCSSEEIPSSFCNIYCLIPAPRCAPGASGVRPWPNAAQSGVRSRPRAYHQDRIAAMRTTRSHACQRGRVASPGVATDVANFPIVKGNRCAAWADRKSHPLRGGSF